MFVAITSFCCVVALTLLVIAAWTDRTKRLIANRISAALIVLFFVWVTAGFLLHDGWELSVTSHLLAALGVFVVGYALWVGRMLGGGDVKLLTAVSLWAGTEWLMPTIFLTTLFGAAMAIVLLSLWRVLPHTAEVIFGSSQISASGVGPINMQDAGKESFLDDSASEKIQEKPPTLPYGIAIAFGGIFAISQIILNYGVV